MNESQTNLQFINFISLIGLCIHAIYSLLPLCEHNCANRKFYNKSSFIHLSSYGYKINADRMIKSYIIVKRFIL